MNARVVSATTRRECVRGHVVPPGARIKAALAAAKARGVRLGVTGPANLRAHFDPLQKFGLARSGRPGPERGAHLSH
jgi:hypothetical protein